MLVQIFQSLYRHKNETLDVWGTEYKRSVFGYNLKLEKRGLVQRRNGVFYLHPYN